MLSEKIQSADDILTEAFYMAGQKPLLCFSGGKDSIVMCHLFTTRFGRTKAFSEMCLVPDYVVKEVDAIGEQLNLDRIVSNILDDVEHFAKNHWLKQTPPTKWKASNLDVIRHWKSYKQVKKLYRPTMMVYGRRLEENQVPEPFYFRKNDSSLQVHPIYNWTQAEVWEYINLHDLKFPSSYKDGHKHLLTYVSLGFLAYKKNNNINDTFDVWFEYGREYLMAAAKYDNRVVEYLKNK